MSAVYSLLLLTTLSAFILKLINEYCHFSLIPGKQQSVSNHKVGVAWGVVTLLALYIFIAEIVNTISERHIVPLGNAVFNYRKMKIQNPFKDCVVCWMHSRRITRKNNMRHVCLLRVNNAVVVLGAIFPTNRCNRTVIQCLIIIIYRSYKVDCI